MSFTRAKLKRFNENTGEDLSRKRSDLILGQLHIWIEVNKLFWKVLESESETVSLSLLGLKPQSPRQCCAARPRAVPLTGPANWCQWPSLCHAPLVILKNEILMLYLIQFSISISDFKFNFTITVSILSWFMLSPRSQSTLTVPWPSSKQNENRYSDPPPPPQ